MSSPSPPYSCGMYAERSCSALSALNASTGKRASRSTSLACAATTSRPRVCTRSRSAWNSDCCETAAAASIARCATLMAWPSPRRRRGGSRCRLELLECIRQRADGGERLAPQHAVEELDVEVLLECQHQVHGRERGEAGLVQVRVVGEGIDVDEQAGVLGQDRADFF